MEATRETSCSFETRECLKKNIDVLPSPKCSAEKALERHSSDNYLICQTFSRLSGKDHLKLRYLEDVWIELKYQRQMATCLYLNIAREVGHTAEKLPFHLQERC